MSKPEWRALTYGSGQDRYGKWGTVLEGPKFNILVETPVRVDKVEHHAVVEGITAAINCHGDLVAALEQCVRFLVEPHTQEWLNRSGSHTTAYGETVLQAKAVLAKAKGTP